MHLAGEDFDPLLAGTGAANLKAGFWAEVQARRLCELCAFTLAEIAVERAWRERIHAAAGIDAPLARPAGGVSFLGFYKCAFHNSTAATLTETAP
jgi:hypothetical protein